MPVRERGWLFLEGALPLQGRRLLLCRQKVSDSLLPTPTGGVTKKKAGSHRTRRRGAPQMFDGVERSRDPKGENKNGAWRTKRSAGRAMPRRSHPLPVAISKCLSPPPTYRTTRAPCPLPFGGHERRAAEVILSASGYWPFPAFPHPPAPRHAFLPSRPPSRCDTTPVRSMSELLLHRGKDHPEVRVVLSAATHAMLISQECSDPTSGRWFSSHPLLQGREPPR